MASEHSDVTRPVLADEEPVFASTLVKMSDEGSEERFGEVLYRVEAHACEREGGAHPDAPIEHVGPHGGLGVVDICS